MTVLEGSTELNQVFFLLKSRLQFQFYFKDSYVGGKDEGKSKHIEAQGNKCRAAFPRSWKISKALVKLQLSSSRD